MDVSRRGFLGMLLSAGVMSVEAKSKLAKKVVAAPATPVITPKEIPNLAAKEKILMDSFLPILKVNEGESFSFYHRSGDKVTVGYGTNVEDNIRYLDNVPIFFKGKELSAEERRAFLSTMTSKSNSDLAKYTIRPADAEKMARRGMKEAISDLAQVFKNGNGTSAFYDLPLCMQALCLDVFYNVGRGNFAEYKKFQAAIRERRFDSAVKQSIVYVDADKHTNLKREWMKKRLLAVMRLVQAHPTLQPMLIKKLVEQDYNRSTPATTRTLKQSNLAGEISMALGELALIRLRQQEGRVVAKSNLTPKSDRTLKAPPSKAPAKPDSKKLRPGFLKEKAVLHYTTDRR